MATQFEAFPDPCDNWIVWDLKRDDFAMLGAVPASCLSKEDAIAACALLNRLATGRSRDRAQSIAA